jgi:ferredoxin
MAEERNIHYVSTHDEAATLIDAAPGFWVCDCGCRVQRGSCGRSRLDVCLGFSANSTSDSAHARAISREQALDILREAREKRLVARPYRDFATRSFTDGICFCCDDCCGYFLHPEEACDRGALRETTLWEDCNHCLACVESCHFGARRERQGRLEVDWEQCYGCGLCLQGCPTQAIRMEPRMAAPAV